MGQSLFDKIQAKLELFRLEQRYTRRRNRRSTFVSNAIYVDGEYVYQTPNSTGSSTESSVPRIDALHTEKFSGGSLATPTSLHEDEPVMATPAERKRPQPFQLHPQLRPPHEQHQRPFPNRGAQNQHDPMSGNANGGIARVVGWDNALDVRLGPVAWSYQHAPRPQQQTGRTATMRTGLVGFGSSAGAICVAMGAEMQ